MMVRINKLNIDPMDKWIFENTEDIFQGSLGSFSLFARIVAHKKLIGLFQANDLNAFKRGTKEPAKIQTYLGTLTKDDYEGAEESKTVKSMWD